ncbi:MIP aquaporin TC1A8 family [Teratosphaeria destructans]|uniref:MIP aquaporin TC1A8 family n=1 Tax=Teratosphaeria destructans TaxID=418781 RepID=A0A9W7VZM9_9PEZI|nr:MIP aquaporin TC1A8 family [Teratosphaeria destructans]
MSQGQSSAPPLPALPERAMARSSEDGRTSDDSDRRKTAFRGSYQTGNTAVASILESPEDVDHKKAFRNSYHSIHTVVPSIMERPSEEQTERLETPSRQQVAPWAPTSNALVPESSARASQDIPIRPLGPGLYGRTTSQDYTIYDGGAVGSPTPADPFGKGDGPYRTDEPSFFQQPYRRGPAGSIRDGYESSTRAGKYSALTSGHTPLLQSHKKTPSRAHFHEYDNDIDSAREMTPQKPKPSRRNTFGNTSIYFVRESYDGNGPPGGDVLRLPMAGWMKGPVRSHFVAWLGEFVGTTLFLFFAFGGTLVANIGAQESANSTTAETAGFNPIVTLFVAVSFGFSLMVNVWIFFRVSGGLFNPAVTLGMVMVKAISYIRGMLLLTAQITGAILASFLAQVLFPTTFNVRTTLSASTSVARGVFIEMILTAELVFTVFMLAKEKHKATYMAPVGIGLALFVAELVGVFFTGGSLNPARSFGPCVTTGKWDPEHWIYWVGPSLGAILAVLFYRFIKVLEYEVANPGQDYNDKDEAEAASLKASKSQQSGFTGTVDSEKEVV